MSLSDPLPTAGDLAVGGEVVRRVITVGLGGYAGLSPVRAAARRALRRAGGDRDAAMRAVIREHVALAGAQGFVTNLGGLATLPVALPANLLGVAVTQVHLVGTIAELLGHDTEEESVRTTMLVTLLGRAAAEPLQEAVVRGSRGVVSQVGRRAGASVARGVPLIGGVVGGALDAGSTLAVGRAAHAYLSGLDEPPAAPAPAPADGSGLRLLGRPGAPPRRGSLLRRGSRGDGVAGRMALPPAGS